MFTALALLACLRAAPASPAAAPAMVQRPLPWGEERCDLTIAYLRRHNPPIAQGQAPASCEMVPRMVVIHWTGTRSLEAAWATFAPVRLVGRPDLAWAGEVNVSAHFLVDRDGAIVQGMPADRVARHAIGLNHLAIGIENVGGLPGLPLTAAQVAADAALVRWLAQTWPITHLIGHHEYRALEGTPLFQEADSAYRNRKADPGPEFMAALRAAVADLGLQGAAAGPDAPTGGEQGRSPGVGTP
jgi:hypothetical protein